MKKVDDIKAYVLELIKKGAKASFYKKYARVTAVRGIEGQEVVTKMKNGLEETRNVVKTDENGNVDWIVTNPDGEQYIVPHSKFVQRYKIEVGLDGKYAPKGDPIKAVQLEEDIAFTAPWGEEMTIASCGFLNVTSLDDIYGIQGEEFYNTYAPCDKNGTFEDETLRTMFGQTKGKNKQ